MTDHGTCRVRLENCNRPATQTLMFTNARTQHWMAYRVCDEHATLLERADGQSHWILSWREQHG